MDEVASLVAGARRMPAASAVPMARRASADGPGNAAGAQAAAAVEVALPLGRPSPAPGVRLAGEGVPAPGMVLAGEDAFVPDTTLPVGVTGGVPVVERRPCTDSMVKVGCHPRPARAAS